LVEDKLITLKQEMDENLFNGIIPFWLKNVLDFESNGFNGIVLPNLVIKKDAEKGLLMAARALWLFSRAYSLKNNDDYIKAAKLLYDYLQRYFLDSVHGGYYWLLNYKGEPLDETKKAYGQAFALYALSEYASVSHDNNALEAAHSLFLLMEEKFRDREYGAYIESGLRDFSENPVMKLSDREPAAVKTMNTNLHVMEALANYALHFPSDNVLAALKDETDSFIDNILLPAGHLGMFFNREWEPLNDRISYGHDIEAAWLLTEAAHLTKDKELIEKAAKASVFLSRTAVYEAFDKDGGITCEGDSHGHHEGFKEWWMQAEAIVGFINAFELTNKMIYLEKALSLWDYCKKKLISPEGEWYFYINKDGTTDKTKELAGPWKCPYHTGRACMEVTRRVDTIIQRIR